MWKFCDQRLWFLFSLPFVVLGVWWLWEGGYEADHEVLRTSSGEQLRLGLSLEEARERGWDVDATDFDVDESIFGLGPSLEGSSDITVDSQSVEAQEVLEGASFCEESGDLWLSGRCEKLSEFKVWLREESGESRVLPQRCGFSLKERCEVPQGWHNPFSFKAVTFSGPPSPGWRAVYVLYSQSGEQFLTRESAQREALIKKSFDDEGVLFYTPLGKGFGNGNLYRLILEDSRWQALPQGPWRYHLKPLQPRWRFDGTLAAVLLSESSHK